MKNEELTEKHYYELKKEIEEFNKEKEDLKLILGKIGGKEYSNRDNIINILFLIIILTLFITEITTHFLPTYISLEVSVLLVSIKIVWMIHAQHKYNHFQFWILNSIEFRVNDLTKRLKKIEKYLEKKNYSED